MPSHPTAIAAAQPGGAEFELRTPEDFGIFGHRGGDRASSPATMEEVEHRDPEARKRARQREVLSVQLGTRTAVPRADGDSSPAAGHHAMDVADRADPALVLRRPAGTAAGQPGDPADGIQRWRANAPPSPTSTANAPYSASATTCWPVPRTIRRPRRTCAGAVHRAGARAMLLRGQSPACAAAYLHARLRLNGVRRDLKSGNGHRTVSDRPEPGASITCRSSPRTTAVCSVNCHRRPCADQPGKAARTLNNERNKRRPPATQCEASPHAMRSEPSRCTRPYGAPFCLLFWQDKKVGRPAERIVRL
ncbi:hypothetical protein ACU4GD_24790 [Cupriavidus basilensis]